MLQISALLFAVSAMTSAIPQNVTQLSIARIIGGVGVGAASLLSPLYIAEISPEKIRGRLVTMNQFAIVFGMIIVYIVNAWIAGRGHMQWNIEYGWRYMFGSETLPAVLFFVLLFFVPESPRSLLKQGLDEKGVEVLRRIGGSGYALKEYGMIQEAIKSKQGRFSELFQRRYLRVLVVGIGLAVICQATGINIIMYYAPRIFSSAGLDAVTAFNHTILIGMVHVPFTFVAFSLVDKVGRKICLLLASSGMGVSLLVMGAVFKAESANGIWLLACVLMYVASFAMGMGAIVWVVFSEIYPTRLRGRAMSIAVFFVWVTNYAVAQFFPWMLSRMGNLVFWFYG
jgi:sugar porter (SP) family MFS transporter